MTGRSQLVFMGEHARRSIATTRKRTAPPPSRAAPAAQPQPQAAFPAASRSPARAAASSAHALQASASSVNAANRLSKQRRRSASWRTSDALLSHRRNHVQSQEIGSLYRGQSNVVVEWIPIVFNPVQTAESLQVLPVSFLNEVPRGCV